MSSSSVVPITPDVLVHNEGTVFLFCPLTSQGKEWIAENVRDPQFCGNGLVVVEHRFAREIASAMQVDGLVLDKNSTGYLN